VSARACKCCGEPAPRFGAAPFGDGTVDYFRCRGCGFLFSDFLDDWPLERLKREIYNDAYIHYDPEFAGQRPERTAVLLDTLLGAHKQSIRVLDYGGGDGQLTRLLRARGFADVQSTDPFHGDAPPPSGRFDVIVCIEVFEHLVAPDAVLAAAAALLAPQGVLIFSTKLQPYDIGQCGTGWWYLAPRNGHISLHSRASLEILARRHGYAFGSFNVGVHMAWRELPAFAAFLLGYLRSGPIAERAAAAGATPAGNDDDAAAATAALLGPLLRPGELAIDAGARTGALSRALAQPLGATGRVVAYEPQRARFARLVADAVDTIEPCNVALGDRWGSTWLPAGADGTATIRPALPTDPVTRIRVETVDGLELTHLALLRIAAAATAPAAIDGAAATIAKLRPALHVACAPAHAASLVGRLQALGYRLWWHALPASPCLLALPSERAFDGASLQPVSPDDRAL
jgi:2-polyprenyl-6-hydroxyphenyl methylase/3-demethylubiquinone-9 3-methyltransferase